MRKSISKLIVTGLSLVLALSAYAGVPMKNSQAKRTPATQGVAAKVDLSKGKQLPKGLLKNKKDAVSNSPIASQTQLARPTHNSVLPRLNAPLKLGPASAPLYGVCIYSEDESEMPYALYELSTDPGNNEAVLISDAEEFSTYTVEGACMVGGLYYYTCAYQFLGYIFGIEHYVFNSEDWSLVDFVEDWDVVDVSTLASDKTYNPVDGLIYGCFYNEQMSGFVFASQDPETLEVTPISELPYQLDAVAADANGTVYGIDLFGDLYTIDTATGAMTLVGNTGYEPTYNGSGTIDLKTGVFYWSLNPEDMNSYLSVVDTNTAATDIIYQFPANAEMCGIAMPASTLEEGAPAAVENLVAEFPDGRRTGTVSFTMPSTDFDGAAISGNLGYTIMRNGEIVKQGVAMAGANVKYIDIVPQSGAYTYSVYATKDDVNGPKAKISLWIGDDQPVVPQNVTLNYEDGAFVATWDPVDSSVHDGFLNGDVVYNFRLYKDNDMVGYVDDINACELKYEYEISEDLTLYYCTIEAEAGAQYSDLGVSPTIATGHASAPYREDFEETTSLVPYTIIDANEDGRSWTLTADGEVRVQYNSYYDMDDWMVTPAIRLEAGNEYTFYIAAHAFSTEYKERIEVKMGTAPTVEGLNVDLIAPTVLVSTENTELKATFVCDETADYYFGVHGISDADMYYLVVDYLGVSAGMSVDAPDAPALKAVADPNGALTATITYTAPDKTINGDATEVSKVVVTCGDEVIADNTDVEAGASYTINFDAPEAGAYTFSAVAANGVSEGRTATTTIYIGVNRPGAVTEAKVVETSKPGEVTVTWEPVTTDIDGYPISSNLVTYTIVDGDGIVVDGLTETTYTFDAVPQGQEFVYYGILAETEAGYSPTYGMTDMIAAGTPYDMPVIESFNDGGISYILGTESNGAKWGIATDGDLVDDFDGTNGYMYMNANSPGASAALFTGKINIAGDKPYLSLAYYCISEDDENELIVDVRDCATGEMTTLKTIILGDGVEGEWTPVLLPLNDFVGKTVQVYLTGYVYTYVYVFVDALKVYQPADIDINVTRVSAPAKVKAGQEFDVTVQLLNEGIKDIASYTVELQRNGEVVATEEGKDLASLGTAYFAFEQQLSILDADSNLYTVKVTCEGDENASNNSAEYAVLIDKPNYPVVTDLKAQTSGEGVTLTWSAPNLNPDEYVQITDDFESYDAFEQAAGKWTLVDEDEAPFGGVQGLVFPGIENGVTPVSYFVMNTYMLGVDTSEAYAAHSGAQYMLSGYVMGSQNSDWMISPELCGEAQTISLYAKSFQAGYPETFKILYSTTDMNLDSFIEVETYEDIPAEWIEYTADLPEGAKYFAIQCVSDDCFMFFVDDVTYTPKDSAFADLVIEGYNIYRNGEKINDAPVADATYFDAEGAEGDKYVVTVVYDRGESKPSNEVTPDKSTSIKDTVAAVAVVKTVNRTIVVTGAQGAVTISTVDGKLVYSAAAEERNVAHVAPGVYVVSAGKLVKKVVVK